MKILVTGSTGFLGPYLMMEFSKHGDVSGVARNLKADYQYDLTDLEGVKHLISRAAPDLIIHAAGETDVERCQKSPDKAVESNCKTTENLVRSMHADCRFVYISTDMIYSGAGPHKENSKSENPINMYGMSKLMGEYAAAKAGSYINVRTNFYGISPGGRRSSLVDFLLQRFKSGEPFSVFTDSMFSPLWAQTLAQKLVIMAKSKRNGTFNLGACDGMSKAKFALMVANGMALSAKGARPMEATSLPNRTIRPLDSRMETLRTEASFGFTLPSMETDIKAMCEVYRCTN